MKTAYEKKELSSAATGKRIKRGDIFPGLRPAVKHHPHRQQQHLQHDYTHTAVDNQAKPNQAARFDDH